MKKPNKPRRDPMAEALTVLWALIGVMTWTLIALETWPALRQWLSR